MVELLLSAGADKNQVKLNLNGWANLMEGCILRVRMRDAESHFLCFYFLIDVFMIHDILVLLFTSIYYFLTENHQNDQIQTPPPFRIFLLGETLPYHFPG